MKHNLLAAVLLGFSVLPLQAQFKWGGWKTVNLSVPRPPDVGLTVKRVAFGQPSGECAAELVDRMIMPDFQANRVDVIERQHLDQILAEHNFNKTAYADADSAVKLGKILGPSALVLVSVYSCRPEQQNLFQDQKDYNEIVHRLYISRTRFSLEGSIRIVDLKTGKVLGSHNFQDKPEKQNTAENAQPEFPHVDELKDQAMDDVKRQIHQMFFPGVDVVTLPYYDEKDCGLKQAYEVLRGGDTGSALKLLLTDVDQCGSNKKKEKVLARAYYDAGLAYCLQKEYDRAKEFFDRATQTKGADAAPTTSATCNRAQEGGARVKSYLDRLALIPEPSPIVAANESAPPTAGTPSAQQSPPAATRLSADATNAPSTGPPSKPTVEERLKKLDALFKKGLITQKEYDQKKAEILRDL